MPTITADLNDLCGLIGRAMNAGELEKALSLVKAELKESDEEGGTGEIRIELTDTNRPDLWCAEGVARQIKAHTSGKPPRYAFFEGGAQAELSVEVDAALREVRPFVAAFAARGPAVTDAVLVQMIQTQEKLCENYGRKRRNVAIGIYNADKIRFPVRFMAAQPNSFTFTPLGLDEPMTLERIMAEHPKGKEYAHLVRGKAACPILADADGKVLSFPPIINSRETGEVKVGDDHLFVEATGTDMRQLLLVINIMAANFADRGWQVEPVRIELPYDSELGRQVQTPASLNVSLEVELVAFQKAIGEGFTAEEVAEELGRYGLEVAMHGGEDDRSREAFKVHCPPWRDDYLHPMDVVEDFAISRGFDTFNPVMPAQFTVGKLKPITLLIDRVRGHMTGFGFEEIFSNILSNRETERGHMLLGEEPIVTIDNVMSETYSVLRSSILPSLLRVEAQSSKALYPHKLFEAGEVCIPDDGTNTGSRTESRIAAVWAAADTGFSEIHSVLDMLLYYLVQSYELKPRDFPFYFEGRSGEVILLEGSPEAGKDAGESNDQDRGRRVIGHIGEVHPEVLTRFGITMPCAAFEIVLDP